METTVLNYLLSSVKRYPNKIAVEDKNGSYTFTQLLGNGVQISDVLKKEKLRNSPVAVLLPKSREMIACFAGINLSSNFYVPLDTTQPQSRIKNILDVLDCKTIVTDEPHASI